MADWRALAAQALQTPIYPHDKTAKGDRTPSEGGSVGSVPAPDRDTEERAAIIEEGAKVPREWADGFARLLSTPAPSGVLPRDWMATLDAAGNFIDQWAEKAQRLGWTVTELFGVDPKAPLARLDRRGVAFALAGHQVRAITENEVVTERDGQRMRLFRPSNPGPLAWEALP